MTLFINLPASRKIIGRCVYGAFAQLRRTSKTWNEPHPYPDNVPDQKKRGKLLVNLLLKGTVTAMAKDDAEKLANRKNMVLTHLEKPQKWMQVNAELPVYYFQERRRATNKDKDKEAKSQGWKGKKNVAMRNHIADNDFQTKVKQILKLLQKDYVVVIRIDADDQDSALASQLVSKIEKSVGGHAVLTGQVNAKYSITLEYSPLKKETQSTTEDSTPDNAENKS